MEVMLESLDHGEPRVRSYKEPYVDTPAPVGSQEHTRQCARQLERWVELRQRIESPEIQRDWIDRHPYLSWAITTAALLGSGYYLYRRMR